MLSAVLIGACAKVPMEPLGRDVQTLLVLPIFVENKSQRKNYVFDYKYDIVNTDGEGLVAEAIFKLPVQEEFLVIDYLPPGNYSVRKSTILPSGGGTLLGDGSNSKKRDFRFRLEEGKITIFDQALVIRKNAHSIYNTLTLYSMEPLTATQYREIYAGLQAYPNFGQWQITNHDRDGVPELQGPWRVKADTAIDEDCGWQSLQMSVEGSFILGWGIDRNGKPFELNGIVKRNGAVKADAADGLEQAGSLWGNFSDGEFRGFYRDADNCRRLLRLVKAEPMDTSTGETEPMNIDTGEAELSAIEPMTSVTPLPEETSSLPANDKPAAAGENAEFSQRPAAAMPLSGRYRSNIKSRSIYAFKKPLRDIEITLVQEGNRIRGFDDDGLIEIGGEVEGDRIRFNVMPSIATGFYDIDGEWKISAGGATLEGSWQDSRGDPPGTWNLYKLE